MSISQIKEGTPLKLLTDPALCSITAFPPLISSSHCNELDLKKMNGDDEMCSSRMREKAVVTASDNVAQRGERQAMDWRSLFSSKPDQSLQFFLPSFDKGKCVVRPPQEVLDEGTNQWRSSVLVQFLGRAPNFSQFQKVVNLLWGREGEVEIKPAGRNLYIIQLPNLLTRDWVIEAGPWHIQNKVVIVRKWEPGLHSPELNMKKIPVWIKVGNVPLELYTSTGLSHVASALGQPLYMDRVTALKQKLEFAKVCVEVDVETTLLKMIDVELGNGAVVLISVEVAWMPPRCTRCKVFGHGEKQCHEKPVIFPTVDS